MPKHTPTRKLRSGMSGNGGPKGVRSGSGKSRPRPYRVAAVSAGQWSKTVAGNSSRIWRDER